MKLETAQVKNVLRNLRFRRGLVTAVVRDYQNKEVLMVAWQNREAVRRTLSEGKMHYWSRERKKLWMKGETSGNVQLVKAVYVDCDGDTLLYDVKQIGGACHKGYRSCFFRKLRNGKLVKYRKRLFNPSRVYR